MTGQIPQSPALQEAGSGAESLTELMSRDPAQLSDADLDRLIGVMRTKREDWEKQEAAAPARRQAQKVLVRAEDIGL